MYTQTWGDVLVASFQNMWAGVVSFLPQLLLAIIIFIVGWLIAIAIGKLVAQIIRAFKVDKALQKIGVEECLAKGGFRLDSGAFVGALVKWFIIIVFLIAASDIVGLSQVSIFLRQVVGYLPNVIVAVIILLAAALIANVARRVVVGSAKAADLPSAALLGGITNWAIWVFAILAALYQLGVAGAFMQTLLTGLVAMIAIAGGLAFGLGGKDAAARFLERLRRDVSHE